MRCKLGDLVIVTGGLYHLGAILKLVRLHSVPVFGEAWESEEFYPHPLWRAAPILWLDSTLTPIRPQPGEDETFSWAGKPQPTSLPTKDPVCPL